MTTHNEIINYIIDADLNSLIIINQILGSEIRRRWEEHNEQLKELL